MRHFAAKIVGSDALVDSPTGYSPTPMYIASGTLSASFSAPMQNVQDFSRFAYHFKVQGTLSGSVGIYASCEPGNNTLGALVSTQGSVNNATNGVTNWVLVGGAYQNISGSGTYIINLWEQGYKWAQLQYAQVSGTGSMDVWVAGKSSQGG